MKKIIILSVFLFCAIVVSVIAFLKLLFGLHWSWWGVTSPLWMAGILSVIVFICGFLLAWLEDLSKYLEKKYEQSKHQY